MQIERYQLTLEVKDRDMRLFHSPARGALLHGLLMRSIGSADFHSTGKTPRPFSQHLCNGGEQKHIWTINLLHETAAPLKEWLEQLRDLLSGPAIKREDALQLHIEHYDCSVRVCKVEQKEQVSYEELFASSLNTLPPKFVSFNFLTPLVFKRAGQESPHPFPEPRLIVQSALSRWNAFSDCAKFEEKDILDEINRFTSIFSFKLNSQHVAMDKIDFAGATGLISYVVHRSELRQIFDLCGRYSEFSGLGAKTAMGLGATKYTAQSLDRGKHQKKVTDSITEAATELEASFDQM